MTQTFKIIFINQGSVYEIYSREVYQSDMFGFVPVDDIVFGEKYGMVVYPS